MKEPVKRYALKSGEFYLSNVDKKGRMLLVTGIESARLYFDKDAAKLEAFNRKMKIFEETITETEIDDD